jgi:hypothetical protein
MLFGVILDIGQGDRFHVSRTFACIRFSPVALESFRWVGGSGDFVDRVLGLLRALGQS